MRKWIILSAIVCIAFTTMAARCQSTWDWGARVTEVVNFSPHSTIWMDSQIVPSIGGRYDPEVCHTARSEVSNRGDYCRVIWGNERSGDNHDWIVDITLNGGTPALPGPVAAFNGQYWTITTPDGQMFENCWKDTGISSPSPGLIMLCDFKIVAPFISTDSPYSGLTMGNVLDELWHWNKYELNPDQACAGSIALLWANAGTALVTYHLLSDCVDRPYDGAGLP